MKDLIQLLISETQDLKVQYLAKTREWAERKFAYCQKQSKWKEVDWCEYFGLEPMMVNAGTSREFLTFPKNFYNTKDARIFDRLKSEINSVLRLGLENFLIKEDKIATDHYNDSIEKLAFRITKKGLNLDAISVKSASIGVNINTIITDGTQTVKAFTIIAEGAIQRPHYRYLVK